MISLNTSIENTVSPYQLELMTFCSCRVGCWVGKVVGIFRRENEKTRCGLDWIGNLYFESLINFLQ